MAFCSCAGLGVTTRKRTHSVTFKEDSDSEPEAPPPKPATPAVHFDDDDPTILGGCSLCLLAASTAHLAGLSIKQGAAAGTSHQPL